MALVKITDHDDDRETSHFPGKNYRKYGDIFASVVGWGADEYGIESDGVLVTNVTVDRPVLSQRNDSRIVLPIKIHPEAFAKLYEETTIAGRILDLTDGNVNKIEKDYAEREGIFALFP